MVTRGDRPVWWLRRGGALQRLAVPQVAAIDTTGAGDVFHAALALAIGEGRAERAAVAFAATAAALKCLGGPGVLGAPARQAVERALPRSAVAGPRARCCHRTSGRQRAAQRDVRPLRQRPSTCSRATGPSRASARTRCSRAAAPAASRSTACVRASTICSRPASDEPTPASSFSASAACIVPMMPTSGANTPSVAHATSSNAASGGNTQA